MADDVTLTENRFDPSEEYSSFASALIGEGAIATCTGIARTASIDGAAVHSLFLDHHPRLTLKSMQAIANEAYDRFDVARLRIVHRYGEVLAGDAIVFVAAAALHRRAALQSVDYMMDRLKSEAMFWKKEIRDEGGQWIEPTEEDRLALARWDGDNGGD